MKILKYISFAVAVFALATACQQDEIDTYSGKSDVFFYYGRGYGGTLRMGTMNQTNRLQGYSTGFDNAVINFDAGYGAVNDTLIPIEIYCSGPLSDVERKVAVAADSHNEYTQLHNGTKVWDTSARAGMEYEVVDAYIEANKPNGWVVLRLINSDSLKNAGAVGLNLRLKLLPNENFTTGYTVTVNGDLNRMEEIYRHIVGTDEEEQPIFEEFRFPRYNILEYRLNFNSGPAISPLWHQTAPGGVGQPSYMWTHQRLFGAFSRVKLEFMARVFKMDYETLFPSVEAVVAAGGAQEYFYKLFSNQLMVHYSYCRALNLAMNVWREENMNNPAVPKDEKTGQPIMVDENGNPVTFPMSSLI
jgi:hypothetical protein